MRVLARRMERDHTAMVHAIVEEKSDVLDIMDV